MAQDKKPRRVPGGRGPSVSGSNRKPRSSSTSPAKGRPATRRTSAKPKRKRTRKMQGNRWQRFRRWLFNWRMLSRLFSVGLTVMIMLLFAMIYFAQDLPDISGLGAARKTPGIQITSASGEIIGSYGQIYGDYLQYRDLPESLINAVLATEDRRFFSHFGIDPLGIARAMVVNIQAGRFVQGGSTVTQQLAKNVFLTPDRTLKRKLQEMLLAFWLEGRFTKEEIISIYLNRVYMGAGNYGVDAASRHYFEKSARDLKLAEAAMIAGLLKAPSRYSPTSDAELAKKRAHQVLLNMADAEMITKEEAEQAIASLAFPDKLLEGGKSERYFTDWIVDLIPDYISHVEEDLIIRTTLEPSMQRYAEEAIDAQLTSEVMAEKDIGQAALLAMRPDGAIVAMVGGRDYAKSQYNRTVQAKRQPGSAFKLFTYLAAMEEGYTPDDMIEDRPVSIPVYRKMWSPKNYDGKYRGIITIREALTRSINTIAAQLIDAVGPSQVVTVARRLGVRSELNPVPSLALGSAEVTLLEMVTAYAHLASGGNGVRPYAIAEIVSKRDGDVLYEYHPPMSYLVIKPNVVAMMNSMLSNVISSGTGRGAAIGRPAAGKTGTTSDYKDAWFMGYTPDLAAGVWMGKDDATPMKRVTGGAVPARVWKGFMSKALEGTTAHALPTQYTVLPSYTLPWLNGTGETSQGPVSTRTGQRPSVPPSRPRNAPPDDAGLGRSFWDKLFDDNRIEHEYPTQR